MNEQMEIDLGSRLVFKPAADRSAPLVWIEELRVYREFSPDAEQCRYGMRPGLNILWADPGPGGKQLYEEGVRGHAAGKTTFCRMLRYALGEKTYGTAAFRNALVGQWAGAVLLAKVWLDGVSWVVCRPLGADARDIARPADSIDGFFAHGEGRIPFKDFLAKLELCVTAPFAGSKLPSGFDLTWRYLLPWLSRDQECRLAHLVEWRDTESESHRPGIPKLDGSYIVRRVMGLISPEEEKAQASHRELLDISKTIADSVPLKQHLAQQALAKVKKWATEQDAEGHFLIDSARKALKDAIARIEQDERLVSAKGVYDMLQTRYEAESAAFASAETDYRREADAYELDKRQLRALAGDDYAERSRQQMEAMLPAPSKRCNTLMEVAWLHQCPCAKARAADLESVENLDNVRQGVQSAEEAIRVAGAELDAQRIAVDGKRQCVADAKAERDRACLAYETLRRQADQEYGALKRKLVEVDTAEEQFLAAHSEEGKLEAAQKDVAESLATQEKLRERAASDRERFNGLFDDIIKAVLGKDVSASMSFRSNSIVLTVDCKGERTSAATETVKILAFDLAALLQSAEGFGHHPRFLIHDSPREADMSNDIYQRFFLYMEALEKHFSVTPPNFQYIVTTTEPPPTHLQSKPHLIAQLDASTATGRLLGVDL